MRKLYKHQEDCINILKNNNIGQIVLPTGTGKTLIQMEILRYIIINKPGFLLGVINSPKITLSYQLIKEFWKYLNNYGIPAKFGIVHSGGELDNDTIQDMNDLIIDKSNQMPSEIPSTTSSTDINSWYNDAQNKNIPLLLFSTYNSSPRILSKRDIELNDEAHYLVQEQHNNILNIKADKRYFFTATRLVTNSDNGTGMNNKELYGEILYEMQPKEAINIGSIVRPRLHILELIDDIDVQNYSNVIYKAYNAHKNEFKGYKAKLLVTISGLEDISNFLKSDEYNELLNNGVYIFTTSSKNDLITLNGEKITEQKFLKELQNNCNDLDKEVIVLHYNKITEGIDVSGLTGVLILRNLEKNVFVQTFGRIARLDNRDRANINENKLNLSIFKPEEWYKPYAWVIIPVIEKNDHDTLKNIEMLISEIRNIYDKDQLITITKNNGLSEDINLENLNHLDRRSDNSVLVDLKSIIENEENAKMNLQLDKISKIKNDHEFDKALDEIINNNKKV